MGSGLNYSIRAYKNEDYEMISNWWIEHTGEAPVEGAMIEQGTFILEIRSEPALCLTALTTSSKQLAYIHWFVKNPLFEQSLEHFGKILFDYCCEWLKEQGFNNVRTMAEETSLQNKYKRFGFKKEMSVLTLMKELV